MHIPASPKAIESLSALLQSPQSVLYADTCVGAKNKEAVALGLSFISSIKEELLRHGKKIHILHYVHNEVLNKKARKERWAIDMLNFIRRNKKIFTILEKSAIENELDEIPGLKHFADEALRRTALSDVSHGRKPVFLTGDYACGLSINTCVPESEVFVIDRNAQAIHSVLCIEEFVKLRTSVYIADKLPAIFSQADIVLTSSALRSKEFPNLAAMLKLCASKNQKLPVYVHETSLTKAQKLPSELGEILHKIHVVKDGDFHDEESRLLASYLVRQQRRNIILVGSHSMLSLLREKAAKTNTSFCHGRHDAIQYCTIGLLGMLHALKTPSASGHAGTYILATKILQQTENAAEENEMDQIVAKIMQAARRGNTSAMTTLSLMYKKGCGVTKSSLMAQLWAYRGRSMKKQADSHSAPDFKNKLSHIISTLQSLTLFILARPRIITSI